MATAWAIVTHGAATIMTRLCTGKRLPAGEPSRAELGSPHPAAQSERPPRWLPGRRKTWRLA